MFDALAAISGPVSAPTDGDLLVCAAGCGAVAAYQIDPLGQVSVRAATEVELAAFWRDADNRRCVNRIRAQLAAQLGRLAREEG